MNGDTDFDGEERSPYSPAQRSHRMLQAWSSSVAQRIQADLGLEIPEWLRDGAEKGDPQLQFELGCLYGPEKGAWRDEDEARKWFSLAAAQGHPGAQNNLAIIYIRGHCVAQDLSKSERLLRLAGELGRPAPLANLGGLYALGLGVPQDLVAAYMLHDLAEARFGGALPDKAAELRAACRSRMTSDQFSEAERRARSWVPGDSLDFRTGRS